MVLSVLERKVNVIINKKPKTSKKKKKVREISSILTLRTCPISDLLFLLPQKPCPIYILNNNNRNLLK